MRFEFYSLIHVGKSRIIVLLMIHLYLRAYHIGRRQSLGERDALVHIVERTQGVAFSQHQLCSCQIASVVVGIKLQQLRICGFRPVVVFEVFLANCLIHHKYFFLGHIFQSHIVVGYGFAIFLQGLSRYASHLICIYYKRIDFERLVAVGLGSAIVIEIDFCHCAIEIWHGKIGFCLYHLVEILYRQHIVLKIKCVAPYVEHLLGVNLSFHAHHRQ